MRREDRPPARQALGLPTIEAVHGARAVQDEEQPLAAVACGWLIRLAPPLEDQALSTHPVHQLGVVELPITLVPEPAPLLALELHPLEDLTELGYLCEDGIRRWEG